MMLGRTMIGERCWDVSRAIDVLEALPEVDAARIAVMGNSGGGTIIKTTGTKRALAPRLQDTRRVEVDT